MPRERDAFHSSLKKTPGRDSTRPRIGEVAYNTIVMHGSELGDSGPHKTDRIPYVFAGGRALGFKLGQSNPAHALSAEVPTRDPSLVGAAFGFRAVASDVVGTVEYRWNFGDARRRRATQVAAQRTRFWSLPTLNAVRQTRLRKARARPSRGRPA